MLPHVRNCPSRRSQTTQVQLCWEVYLRPVSRDWQDIHTLKWHLLLTSQAFELRLWDHQHPLRQFGAALPAELLFKMEDRGLWLDQLQVRKTACNPCF